MAALEFVRWVTVQCCLPGLPGKQHRLWGAELFQRNLAHGLVAHDFADFQTLDRQLTLLVLSAHQFGADGVELIPQTIECSHIGIFYHEQNIVVLLSGSVTGQDFVVCDNALAFCFVIGRFEYLG